MPFTERPALIEGAVGLLSTVPDYLRFSQMLLNQGQLGGVRLLRPETVQSMTRNGLSDGVLRARGGGMGWGLANVNVVIDPAGLGYPANRGEYGWDGSAGTIFWIDPGKRAHHDSDDAERAGQPRFAASALQDARSGRSRRLRVAIGWSERALPRKRHSLRIKRLP